MFQTFLVQVLFMGLKIRSCRLRVFLICLIFPCTFASAELSSVRAAGIKVDDQTSNVSSPTIRATPPYFVVARPRLTGVLFQCYVDDLPAKNGQILWVRNGQRVPCLATKRVRACGNTLTIERVGYQDQGQYKCVLSDQQWISYTVTIFVPLMLCNPGNKVVTVYSGEDKQLDCCISNKSYPRPQGILWSHNGQYIAIQPLLGYINYYTGTLYPDPGTTTY
jgi:hypothetical protein